MLIVPIPSDSWNASVMPSDRLQSCVTTLCVAFKSWRGLQGARFDGLGLRDGCEGCDVV